MSKQSQIKSNVKHMTVPIQENHSYEPFTIKIWIISNCWALYSTTKNKIASVYTQEANEITEMLIRTK